MKEGNGELFTDDNGNLLLSMEDGTAYILEEVPDALGNKVKVSMIEKEVLH